MIYHHKIIERDLWLMVKQKKICFAGNKKLRIFGTLKCKPGKRMNKQNRVFFVSIKEAEKNGYRPCAHCMNAAFKKWKNELV